MAVWFSVMLTEVTNVITGSVLENIKNTGKEKGLCQYGVCFQEAHKLWWPYVSDSPQWRMLFSMQFKHHRGGWKVNTSV